MRLAAKVPDTEFSFVGTLRFFSFKARKFIKMEIYVKKITILCFMLVQHFVGKGVYEYIYIYIYIFQILSL
jgi:hypothetical protein